MSGTPASRQYVDEQIMNLMDAAAAAIGNREKVANARLDVLEQKCGVAATPREFRAKLRPKVAA